ncbi:flagellar assembly protein FliH [Niallia sp. 01092]|uniref:flagellar assembly protein FliH n=1 Tax=unclassified Niallia TaxID=2837522 RepID=UPI003FD3264A
MSRLIKSKWAGQHSSNEKIISIKYLHSLENAENELHPGHQKMLEEAAQEANLILQKAKEQIDKQKEQFVFEKQNWDTEKKLLIEEAKTIGYNAGLEEGRNIGYDEFRQHIQSAQDVVEASKNDYQSYMQSAEKTILQLGIKVAEKIINESISTDNEYFLHLVKKVLQETQAQKEIQLHVHPSQFEYILSEKEELLNIFPIQPNLFVFPNENVSENGCMIETANGRIDANIDTQLQLIKQKLLDILESE